MSGIRPLFTSAPRLKLRIGQNVIAYAIGFNVNMTVSVDPVYSIGEYGPVALEPTMYNTVTGTLQILRLRSPKALQNDSQMMGGLNFNTTNVSTTAATSSTVAVTNLPLAQQNLFQMLDPAQVLTTSTIQIDVYIRVPVLDSTAIPSGKLDGSTSFADSAQNLGITQEFLLMSIQDARIISRNSNISMGSLVNEPVNFQGLMLTGSSQLNSHSGSFSLDSSVVQG